VELLLNVILKLCLTMMKKGNPILVTRTITMLALAAVLTFNVLSNNSFSTIIPAFADGKHHKGGGSDQIPTVVTIPLEGLSLGAGQFLLLSDTTPVKVRAAHIAINVPCEDLDHDRDIVPVAGVKPDVRPVQLEFVSQLSSPPDNCLFHGDIPNNSDKVTDIAIINTGADEIQFNSGNFATLAITKVRN
jgi:hypothetical protein